MQLRGLYPPASSWTSTEPSSLRMRSRTATGSTAETRPEYLTSQRATMRRTPRNLLSVSDRSQPLRSTREPPTIASVAVVEADPGLALAVVVGRPDEERRVAATDRTRSVPSGSAPLQTRTNGFVSRSRPIVVSSVWPGRTRVVVGQREENVHHRPPHRSHVATADSVAEQRVTRRDDARPRRRTQACRRSAPASRARAPRRSSHVPLAGLGEDGNRVAPRKLVLVHDVVVMGMRAQKRDRPSPPSARPPRRAAPTSAPESTNTAGPLSRRRRRTRCESQSGCMLLLDEHRQLGYAPHEDSWRPVHGRR